MFDKFSEGVWNRKFRFKLFEERAFTVFKFFIFKFSDLSIFSLKFISKLFYLSIFFLNNSIFQVFPQYFSNLWAVVMYLFL